MFDATKTEQIRILYSGLGATLLGTGSVTIALTALLYPLVEPAGLLIWFAAAAIMWAVRLGGLFSYRRLELNGETAARLARRTVIYGTVYGVLWAWLPLYYFTADDFVIISHIGLFSVGMLAGALVTQAVYLPALYAFLIPVVTGSILALILKTDQYAYLSIFVIAYGGIGILFGRKVHEMLLEVIRTRFANDSLLVELRQQKREAEEANQAKSKFLASASHDVRQPMHAMAIYVGMLKDDPGNTQIVERIDQAMHGLEELYGSVLEISQLDAGALNVDMKPVALHEVISQIAAAHQAHAEQKGIALEVAIPNSTWVFTDPLLLRRVVENLLTNALRYTNSGSIVISARSADDAVKIDVTDTGIGIPAERLEDIFDEYVQVNNSERDRSKGLGLGLSIVRRLCDLLGHEISVSSEPGKGTSFSLRMNAAEPAETVTSFQPQDAAAFPGCRILLIEDDAEVADALCAQLERWNCTVEWINRGDLVSEVENVPDIAIVDYRLPGEIDGIESVHALRQRFGSDIRCVFMTGETAPDVIRRLRDSGHAILHKPVRSDQLKRELAAMLAPQRISA